MILKGYEDFSELYRQIPSDILKKINKLWVELSEGKFGFSVQKSIYQGLATMEEYNYEIWDQFCDCIGWKQEEEWFDYNSLPFNLDAPRGNLLVLYSTKGVGLGWIGLVRIDLLVEGGGVGWVLSLLLRKDL